MLTSIRIEKLFDTFDYDIEFNKEGITILTGPNGYGKTTVLKIIDALASKNGFFFVRLLFHRIILNFSNNDTITLEKKKVNEVVVTSTDKSKRITWNSKSLTKILKGFDYFRQVGDDRWIDRRSEEIYSTDALLQKAFIEYPELDNELSVEEYPIVPSVYFIREQRLLRPLSDNRIKSRVRGMWGPGIDANREISTFTNTIEEYSKELRENIREILARSSQINQELDSSFPRRLFDQKNDISEDEFKLRFDKVKQIQKSLNEFGLSEVKEDSHPTYKAENAKALCVYIEDTEQKLEVFSELLGKLKAFTDILNERRFIFKRMTISSEDGFRFATDQGKPLSLGDLSSGEQQEVVMLYELLFKVKAGTLVLIDEPELSLHVVWQKQFLDDLFQIISLKKINIIIATHSPQIINNHWDLTVDLEDLRNASISR